MKIEHLEIKNYKQFADLTLDLTYPKGHEKEGEPLDKICIIGQSGTGKTNLLELIGTVGLACYESSDSYFLGYIKENLDNKYSIKAGFELTSKGIKNIIKREFTYKSSKFISNIKTSNGSISKPFDINDEFSEMDEHALLEKLSEEMQEYQLRYNQYVRKLSNKLLNHVNYNKSNYQHDIKIWQNHNDILYKTSIQINKFLKKFNIELTLLEDNDYVNFDDYQDYDYETDYECEIIKKDFFSDLKIKDLATNNIINYWQVSSGTKKLISTFLPLKIHNPHDTIVLIDEPENSFYPDIQRELTDLYMNVGENNQLIMATHSPLVASSFEPWEIVELKFDKNNQISREFYYPKDEENHVDNYILDPRMLTWTSILTDIFDLKEDSCSLREQKLMEYGMLKSEIKAMTKGKERDEKIKEFKKMSSLLGLQN